MGKDNERKNIVITEKSKIDQLNKIEEEIRKREEEINRIRIYIKQKYDRLIKVLGEVKHILKMYQHSSEGRRSVYIVTSRGDYQGGNEIKDIGNIYQKILDRRNGREGDPNPYYSVENVEDLIGVRLVCIYPSDIKSIAAFIKACNSFENLDEDEKKEGYFAYHFTVSLAGKPELSNIVCEIQIRTMLLEAWYFKSHGLTYKGEFAKKEHERQADLLSKSLTVIDEQSESLKDQIMQDKAIEQSIRLVTKGNFLKKLTLINQQDCSKPDLVEKIDNMKKHLEENSEEIYEKNPEIINLIWSQITDYKKTNGIDLNLCRIIAILATTVDTDEFEGAALDSLDELINKSESQPEKMPFLFLMKANLCYGFGKLQEATDWAKEAMNHAELQKNKRLLTISKQNTAYFIAESRDKDREREARKYSIEALEADPLDSEVFDTLGFVKIFFGSSYEEVQTGLKYCEEATKDLSDNKSAHLYLKIHRIAALAKLLEFTEKS